MSESKKILQKNCTLPYKILKSLNCVSYNRCKDIRNIVNINKQLLNYYIRNLDNEGFVTKVFHGAYKITSLGKKILEELEKKQSKQMIRLENMRYKYPVYSGVGNMLNRMSWSETNLKNVKVYHGKFKGYSLRLFVGRNHSIEITCKHEYGTNLHEIMWDSRNDIEGIMLEFSDKYNVKLGKGKQSMKPDIAIPSKLAKSLLKATGTSQIKSSKMVLNQSKGRDVDLETHDVESAKLVLELPYMIEKISKQMDEIKDSSHKYVYHTGLTPMFL